MADGSFPHDHNGGPPLDIEYERPPLYEAQRLALFDCPDVNGNMARYGICEASTKAGKTVGCIAWLCEQAWLGGAEGRNYWWIAPVYNQAKIAFTRMKRYLPRGSFRADNQTLTITLGNGADRYKPFEDGAKLIFKSGEKPDNLYGEDVYAAVIDEASRMREESWHAIRSTLTATRGPVRIIGNVKGRGNWFFKIARLAQDGRAGFSYRKITAYDAVAGGVLAMDEIEDAKATLPEHVFRELYLAEPADDEGNPFGYEHIKACIGPLSDEPAFCAGVDLAKKRDWTVVIGLDRFGNVCGYERWQKKPWGWTVTRVGQLVGRVPMAVDATGVGDPIVEQLQNKHTEVEGFVFTPRSKQMLMEGLVLDIQSHNFTFPDKVHMPSPAPGCQIVEELNVFEYEYTRTGVLYTAPSGYNDDCVMALALARQKYRQLMPGAPTGVLPGGEARVSPWFGATSGDGDDDEIDERDL